MDLFDREGVFCQDVVDELNDGLLVVAGVGTQHPEAGAVVDAVYWWWRFFRPVQTGPALKFAGAANAVPSMTVDPWISMCL
ncbi:hypothetical protein [Streptomyces sp. NPDC003487]